MNIKNISKDWLLLTLILIFWFSIAIILRVHPIAIVFAIILHSPLFVIGLFLSKRNAIIVGFGLFAGFYIKQSMCFHYFANPFHIIFILIIFVGISMPLFTSIIGNKLNNKQFEDIEAGIIGFVILSAIYYFLFPCGMG